MEKWKWRDQLDGYWSTPGKMWEWLVQGSDNEDGEKQMDLKDIKK